LEDILKISTRGSILGRVIWHQCETIIRWKRTETSHTRFNITSKVRLFHAV